MDWSVILTMLALMAVQGIQQVSACESTSTLGMGTGDIKNSSITSSSSLPGHEAIYGRVHSDKKHWSWCPANPIEEDSYEWIQIDFEEMVEITHIVIGGDFGDGEGTRYPKKFRVEYQRTESDAWLQWVLNGTQVFPGNSNSRQTDLVNTKSKLLAARVRIIPVIGGDIDKEDVCVRLEFYGCHRHGVATYSIPQGDTRGDRYHFLDREYDGIVDSNGRLSGGLGRLTNGTIAGDEFSQDPFLWVGWRNDIRNTVEMKFEMDHLRNISLISIHSNNQLNKDIRVFRKANIYADTANPVLPTDEPIKVFEYTRDQMESSRTVEIPLNSVLAKFVTVVLEFDAKWIMISQVTFTSQLVIGQYPDGVTSTAHPPVTSGATTRRPLVRTTRTPERTAPPHIPEAATTADAVVIPSGNHPVTADPGNNMAVIDRSLIGIIVGSCLGVILVVIVIICVCCFYQRKKMSSATSNDSSAGEGSTTSIPPVLKTHTGDNSEYDLPWGSRPLPHPPPNGATMQSSGYASDGYGGAPYASIPVDQYNNCHQLTPVPQSCLHHYMTSGGLLTLPGVHHDRHQCNRAANTLPANAHNNLLIPLNNKGPLAYDSNQYDLVQRDTSPYDSSNYRSSPTVPLPNIQSGTGSSVYGVPANSQLDQDIPQIPYDSLRFIEKIGSGQCGEVHLCQMTAPTDGGADQQRLVAMKKLQASATEATKSDFMREIKIMSKLRHPNIIQVLGVCTDTASSPCVVTEYMSMGDLNQFLQKHVPEGTTLLNKQALSQSTLLHITAQIARGMSYLEQLNVTHRDLAARNCLVGDNYQVKISDFGMSRNLYSQHYYKVEGRVVLPIRWMAWESVLLGKFTTKSDVWSFGVTLWEIFSFAREQPFTRLSDDDVIANCMNYYSNNMGQVIYLNQPSQCTKEIYDLMRACWDHNDFRRPTFKDISLFLTMKSPHADPSTERRMSPTRLTAC